MDAMSMIRILTVKPSTNAVRWTVDKEDVHDQQPIATNQTNRNVT